MGHPHVLRLRLTMLHTHTETALFDDPELGLDAQLRPIGYRRRFC